MIFKMSSLSVHTEIEYSANVKILKQWKELWKWDYHLPLVPEHTDNIYCSCIERLCILKNILLSKIAWNKLSPERHLFKKNFFKLYHETVIEI